MACSKTRVTMLWLRAGLRWMGNRYGWLLLAAPCLILGYLFVWHRGFYLDDYAFRSIARDEAAGRWVPLRGIQYCLHLVTRFHTCLWNVNMNALLPDHELWIRAAVTLLVGMNSLLLGLLLYRVLHSRLAAVVSGWLLLMPFWAHEAVLWVSAAHYHGTTLTVALVFLHAAVSIGAQGKQWRWWVVVAVVCMVVLVFSIEQFVVMVVLVPFLYLAQAACNDITSYRQALQRIAALLVPLLVGAFLVVLVVYTRDFMYVPDRGVLDLTPAGILERVGEYLRRAVWMTVSPEWGLPLTRDVFRLGWQMVGVSGRARLLLLAALGALAFAVAAWRVEERQSSRHRLAAIIVACGGLALFLTGLTMPMVLLKGQILEYRMFSVAGAGLCVAVGALACFLPRPCTDRAFLTAAGIVLIVSTLCMAGYTRAFQARSRLDQAQIAAVIQAVPASYLPADAYIVPYQTDERLFGRQDRISKLLFGVLEEPWSSLAALQLAYDRQDINTVTAHRWAPMRFDYKEDAGTGRLYAQGVELPLERTVVVTYRNGVASAVASLRLPRPDGSQVVVSLPIAERLSAGGIPVIQNIVVARR